MLLRKIISVCDASRECKHLMFWCGLRAGLFECVGGLVLLRRIVSASDAYIEFGCYMFWCGLWSELRACVGGLALLHKAVSVVDAFNELITSRDATSESGSLMYCSDILADLCARVGGPSHSRR